MLAKQSIQFFLLVTLIASVPQIARAAADEGEPIQKLAMAPERIRVAQLPDDTELESRKAVIGNIDVEVDDVFEHGTSPDEKPLAAPYRLANGLHISTRTATITALLLFRQGDPFSRRVLDETERYLRSQRYLNAATVTPVRYNDDNTVDIEVRVHDVWTFSPSISFGRAGGVNSTSFELADTNVLGFGKQLQVARTNDADRSAWHLKYADPSVFGSFWRFEGEFANATDGGEKFLSIGRPFYSLDSRWSFGAAGTDSETAVSRYAYGQVLEQFRMQRRAFEIGGGISPGLSDGWTHRILGGFRYDDRAFSVYDNQPNVGIPDDRNVSYPWVGYELIQDEYVKTRNLDQIGRTEDLYLGRSARIELGYASTVFGSTNDEVILNGSLNYGTQLSKRTFWISSLNAQGRLDDAEINNGLLELMTKFYLRESPHNVFFVSANAALTDNLDGENQLLLGGDNGLRGYPLRFQAGSKRALLTLEQRFYTDWQPLKLVNVGAAAFFDAGRTWGTDVAAPPPIGWLKDVGVGLRLGSARSGLGNVLHIDLAFPLDGPDTISKMQLLIDVRRSF